MNDKIEEVLKLVRYEDKKDILQICTQKLSPYNCVKLVSP